MFLLLSEFFDWECCHYKRVNYCYCLLVDSVRSDGVNRLWLVTSHVIPACSWAEFYTVHPRLSTQQLLLDAVHLRAAATAYISESWWWAWYSQPACWLELQCTAKVLTLSCLMSWMLGLGRGLKAWSSRPWPWVRNLGLVVWYVIFFNGYL